MGGANGTNGLRNGHPKRRGPKGGRDYKWNTADFLAELRETRSVTKACKRVGICRSTAYQRRDLDEDFRAAWHDEMGRIQDDYEAGVASRAIDGVLEPIFRLVEVREDPNDPRSPVLRDRDNKPVQKWMPVGAKRVFSDTLTIWLGKTRWPHLYSETALRRRALGEVDDDVLQQQADESLRRLSPAGLDAFRTFLEEQRRIEALDAAQELELEGGET